MRLILLKLVLSSVIVSIGILCALFILAFYSGSGYLTTIIESIWFYFIFINTALSAGLSLCLYLLNSLYHFTNKVTLSRLHHHLFWGMLYGEVVLLLLATLSIILDLEYNQFFDDVLFVLLIPTLYALGGLIGGAFYYFIHKRKTLLPRKQCIPFSLYTKYKKANHRLNQNKFIFYTKQGMIFLFIATSHPILALLMFIFPVSEILIYETSVTNVSKINILPFIVTTSILYLMLLLMQYGLLKLRIDQLSRKKFCKAKLGSTPIIISFFGFYHIHYWFFIGMEGNIMGFIFFPYLLILSLISLLTLTTHVLRAFKGTYNYD